MIKRQVFLLHLAMAAALCCTAPAQTQGPFRVIDVQPTALFPKAQPLRQMALMHVENNGSVPQQVTITIDLGGQHLSQQGTLGPGCTEAQLLLPDIASQSTLKVEISAETGKQAEWSHTWQPQRKWTIFIIKSSHEDLGYEGTIFQKAHDNADWIDIGKRLSDPKIPMGGDRFHYNIETLVGARDYITERGEIAWRNLVDTEIKTGNMSLLGAPSGVHSHWMDYEELARMTYPAQREMKDRYGLNFPTFMIVDNPSLSWSGAQVLADAGFRYVARWGQGWRAGGNNDYAHTGVPAIFWWLAPDGQHKVLYGWRSHYNMPLWIGEGRVTPQQIQNIASFEVSKALKSIEDGSELGPYPYDAVVYPQYYDHEIPHAYHGLLANWAEHFAYPIIRMTDPTDFFTHIEQHSAAQIPTLTGDLNNFSADYATIDPESQGWKRAAARELPFAEGMQAVASFLNPAAQPTTDRVAQDYTRLFDYDEHSWPTLPDAQDIHVFNANYVKRETARRVTADAHGLLSEELAAVSSHILQGDGARSVAVWNSRAHPQTGPVVLNGRWGTVVDVGTGKAVATLTTAEGSTVLVANDVPSYGYKVYREAGAPQVPASPKQDSGDTIENEFYRVRLDPRTGNIVSITDKRLHRELVDAAAPYQFNQFVFIHKNQRDSLAGTESSAGKPKSIVRSAGILMENLEITTEDEKTGAEIVQRIRLYAGLPRIDVENTVRHARTMSDAASADRYKDNIFFAFPVNVPGGQPRAEYPGGTVRPHLDQLRWGSQDYLSANRWVDVSTSEYGVTIAPWNEQIFEFGEIRYNQFSVDYKPTKPYLFGYAWSNRMTGLLDLDNEHPEFTVKYSIASHAGDWNAGGASALGWSVASPLTVVELHPTASRVAPVLDMSAQSLLDVDAPNVEVTVLKQSEQPGRGWIVRLVETAGKPTDTTLLSNLLPVEHAWEASIAEDDRAPLAVKGNRVLVHLLPYGMKTIRLTAGSASQAVSKIEASALSGEKARLTWEGQPGLAYNIYRSEDPADPATAQTLVARTAVPSFVDDHLMPMGTYTYHVAAISADNVQGALSPALNVTMKEANTEPPPPVRDLTVVALAGRKHMIAWDKSTATDVREYRIYRCEGPRFDSAHAKLLRTQAPTGYSVESFIAEDESQHKYSYFVMPVDWAGNHDPLP